MAIDPFDKVLNQIQSAQSSSRPLAILGIELGTQRECPTCGDVITLCETTPNVRGRAVRFWSDCSCWLEKCRQAAARSGSAVQFAADYRTEREPDGLEAVAHLTLDRFDPGLLDGPGENPYATATRWLDRILPFSEADSYHSGPPAALYFHSAGKGRGKTHLAAGIALRAKEAGKRVAFADEIGYIERYWAASLEQKARISALPAERAWLTVLDDLGQRERTSDTLRDAWYDVINPRWLARGWLIVTSNYTPDELLARGTLSEASYSRLIQMTRGAAVSFGGRDQRLPQRSIR